MAENHYLLRQTLRPAFLESQVVRKAQQIVYPEHGHACRHGLSCEFIALDGPVDQLLFIQLEGAALARLLLLEDDAVAALKLDLVDKRSYIDPPVGRHQAVEGSQQQAGEPVRDSHQGQQEGAEMVTFAEGGLAVH